MSVDPGIVQWALGFLGTGILAGLGFILRTLNMQNQTLAVMASRLDVAVANVQRTEALGGVVAALDGRTKSLEADMSRVWGIYDAWTTRNPLQHQHRESENAR